jgi:hypothetical protein
MVRSASALLAAGLLVAACGGGTTTVIKKVVTTTNSATTPPPSVPTYLPGLAISGRYQTPSTYTFSADGDLVGKGLRWTGWGTPTATAAGAFVETQHPSMHETSYGGTLTVTGLTPCNGAQYYTQLHVSLPPDALFQPRLAPARTPCG